MTVAVINLPWPDNRLSPNARLHFMAVARVKKRAKADAHYLAKHQLRLFMPIRAEEINVTCEFFPPRKTNYDDDGLLARMKAALDGISDAIGIDDSCFRIKGALRGGVVKEGCVKVSLEWDEVA